MNPANENSGKPVKKLSARGKETASSRLS